MSPASASGFEQAWPLAHGVTLLEASAGTGKTYAITSLVVRLVAEEGLGIDQILVVTFTRAATSELRDRIRRRLAEAADALRGPQEDGQASGDPMLADLRRRADAAGAGQRRLWLERLEAARQTFHSSSIFTIHSFCQRMLRDHAFESQSDFSLDLLPDVSLLLREVVDDTLTRDLYAEGAATLTMLREACGVSRQGLLDLGAAVTADPLLRVLPEPEALSARLARLLPDLGLPVGASGEQPEPRHYLAAVAAFSDAWRTQAEKTLARLEQARASRALDGRTYQERYTERHRQRVEAFLAESPVPLPLGGGDGAPSFYRYFSPTQLRQKARTPAGHALAEEPLFVAWEALHALGFLVATSVRVHYAHTLRDTFARRLKSRNQQTYTDLLQGLADALDDLTHGPPLCEAIRRRYPAALIDEFQDTDGLQWRIFSRLFAERSRLLLIGDPKQAIYGFRGANVRVYLEARASAGPRATFTLDCNHRSDEDLLFALNQLWDQAGVFGEPPGTIDYRPVTAPPREPRRRLRFDGPGRSDDEAPLRLHIFDGGLRPGHAGVLDKASAWELLPTLVAADLAGLLNRGPMLYDPGASEAGPDGFRPLVPADIAVLVRKHSQATAIQQALGQRGVPSIQAATGSVFDSDEALALLRWMRALSTPGHERLARLAAVGPIFGFRAADLLREERGPWDRFMEQLVLDRHNLENKGFLYTFRTVLDREQTLGRLLGRDGGERRATNLLHLAELVHRAEQEQRLRPAGLLAWLSRQRLDRPSDPEAAQMRLETDEAAVPILTMHGSKGLEFPVVFAPYLWDGRLLDKRETTLLRVVDPDQPQCRLLCLEADPTHPDRNRHLALAEAESLRENLRLLYVATTRAKVRCELYWGAVRENETSPLAALLHGAPVGTRPEVQVDRLAHARHVQGQDGEALASELSALAASSNRTLTLHRRGPPTSERFTPPPWDRQAPRARRFTRSDLDETWRSSSFSSILRDAGHERLAGASRKEAGRPGDDEPEVGPVVRGLEPGPALDAVEVPLARFPAGAEAGTCLHEILELLDFTQVRDDPPHGRAVLRALLDDRLPRHGFSADLFADPLCDGLLAMLHTPLGSALGSLRLCDIPPEDRLCELRFELPLCGGLDWDARGRPAVVTSQALFEALMRSGEASGLPPGYAASLTRALGPLRLAGFLGGFMDLVFRAPVRGQDRYFVADYKSNVLDPAGDGVIRPESYNQSGIHAEMTLHHYHLQYLIYTVALHRYLAVRLGRGYDPEEHLGGVYYLFLRGMVGPGTAHEGEQVHGVFFARPETALVLALNQVFETGRIAREDPP